MLHTRMPLSVAPISPGFLAVSAAALATLFALHHLRVRPTRRPVATLLFWQGTSLAQQPRTLRSRRFRHPKTFGLLAAVLLLTAVALTADRWRGGGAADRRDVIVIDAGADMAADDGSGRLLLRRAADLAGADLSNASALIAAGEQPVLLSRGDESEAVIRRRLSRLAPETGASAARLALQLAASVQGSAAGDIDWYTARDQVPTGLPAEVARRVRVHPVGPAAAVAIVGLAFEPAADDPARGTLTVTCAGRATGPVAVTAELGGVPAVVRPVAFDGGRASIDFADVPADGRSVVVRLTGAPGPAPTHEAAFRLPDDRPLTFRFVGDVPLPLRAVAIALGAETDGGRIAVVGPGASVPADAAAAIAVVDQGIAVPPGERLSFAPGTPWSRGLSLEGSVAAGPVPATPGVAVLTAGPATLASLDQTPTRRTLYLSGGLVAATADLPRRAAYPVLLERLCRELVGRPSPPSTVAASRAAQDPLWPGPPESPAGAAAVTLPDDPPVKSATDVTAAATVGRHVPWAEVVLGTALALTVVEAALFAARKIV